MEEKGADMRLNHVRFFEGEGWCADGRIFWVINLGVGLDGLSSTVTHSCLFGGKRTTPPSIAVLPK